METDYVPALRKRYNPEDYSQHPLHLSAAQGWIELLKDAIRAGANIYRPIREGETPLHVGIYNQHWDVVDALMDLYEKDILDVYNHLAKRGVSKSNADIWLKKPIALACTEQERKKAREFENEILCDKMEIIIVKESYKENYIVTIAITDKNRQQVKAYTEALNENGVLAWNYSGPDGKYDTLLQLAAFRGADDLVKRLIRNGADLSIAGRNQMTPLMEACSALQMDAVRLLFENYRDICRPLAKDRIGYTAFLHVIPRSNVEGFDYVLRQSMTHRMEQFGESECEAFNKVFRYEGGSHWSCLSIWSILTGRIRNSFVEPYLRRYDYDLSFRYGDRIMLMELIIRSFAVDYYQSEIRRNPELLTLSDHDGCNVLHCLMWSNELHFIRELYEVLSEKCKTLFECPGAVICLASVLIESHNHLLIFLLENHREFIESILENLIDHLFAEDILPESIFGEPLDILILHFPQIEPKTAELHLKVMQTFADSDSSDIEYSEEYNRSLTNRMLDI